MIAIQLDPKNNPTIRNFWTLTASIYLFNYRLQQPAYSTNHKWHVNRVSQNCWNYLIGTYWWRLLSTVKIIQFNSKLQVMTSIRFDMKNTNWTSHSRQRTLPTCPITQR